MVSRVFFIGFDLLLVGDAGDLPQLSLVLSCNGHWPIGLGYVLAKDVTMTADSSTALDATAPSYIPLI